MKHKAKNLTELFYSLAEIREEVYSDDTLINKAEAMNNSAGKMIKIAALQASILPPEDARKLDILQ